MSGSTFKKKPPADGKEWVRDTEDRLDQIDHSTSTRMGDWTAATDVESGNLVAYHKEGGGVVLARKPPPGQSPDDIAEEEQPLPMLTIERTDPATGSGDLPADLLTVNIGNWGADQIPNDSTNGPSEFVVPEDGYYMISWELHMVAVNSLGFVGPKVNGNFIASTSAYMDNQGTGLVHNAGALAVWPLRAGQVISFGFSVSGQLGGTSNRGNTKMSLAMLRRAPLGGLPPNVAPV